MWRTVYKLVKQLGDVPDLAEPAKVANHVKAQLDKFKLLLPLFQCLCNRGLRPRHWAQISEAVGFEIKGEDGTTFRQLLRLKVGLLSGFSGNQSTEICTVAVRRISCWGMATKGISMMVLRPLQLT
jgi:hypothetical protein